MLLFEGNRCFGKKESILELGDWVDLLTHKRCHVFDLLDVSSVFQSKTGALEGPEVDGFVKDMMELVKVASRLALIY